MKFQQLSQQDPKWYYKKLGYGVGNLGNYGCTITALAMFAGVTPEWLNIKLRGTSYEDSAFAGRTRNLINWTKLEKYTNGLIKFHWRGAGYNATKIKGAIAKHGACLVEVDFDGTGPKQDKHWILAKGNKLANDPWTGNEVPTNKYPYWTGWAEIEVDRSKLVNSGDNDMAGYMYEGYDLNNRESMKVAVDILVKVQNGEFVDKDTLTKCENIGLELSRKIDELQQKLAEKPKEIIKEVEVIKEVIKHVPIESTDKEYISRGLEEILSEVKANGEKLEYQSKFQRIANEAFGKGWTWQRINAIKAILQED